MRRQGGGAGRAQRRGVRTRHRLIGDDVSDQHLVALAIGLAQQHFGVADSGLGPQHCRDLARFDAVPANLQLLIAATEVFESTAVDPPGQIAGSVHPAAGRPPR